MLGLESCSDRLAVMNICALSENNYCFQHPYGCSPLFINAVPGNLRTVLDLDRQKAWIDIGTHGHKFK